ncbi:MAG: DUF4403 family protein [Cytophagales bacterium]|nr:DUF4403 family protein [Cytophagales bacterium]
MFILFSCAKRIELNKPIESATRHNIDIKSGTWVLKACIAKNDLINKINTTIPINIYETGADNKVMNIKVLRGDSIKIISDNGESMLSIPLKINAKLVLDKESTNLPINLNINTDFEIMVYCSFALISEDDNKLKTKVNIQRFEWVKTPKIRAGFFEIDAAPYLEPYIKSKLAEVSSQITESINSKIDLTFAIQLLIKPLENPIKLSDNPLFYLHIIPENLYFSKILLQNDSLYMLAQCQAKTHFQNTEKKMYSKSLLSFKPSTDLLPPSVYIRLRLDNIANMYPKAELEKLTGISDINMYQSGEYIIAEASMSGKYKGRVYLKGKPYLDTTTNEIKFKNMEYELETKNMLVRSAQWMIDKKIDKIIEQKLKVNINQVSGKIVNDYNTKFEKISILGRSIFGSHIQTVIPKKIYLSEGCLILEVQVVSSHNFIIRF